MSRVAHRNQGQRQLKSASGRPLARNKQPWITIPKQSPRAIPTLSATEVAARANSCRAGTTSKQIRVKAFTYTAEAQQGISKERDGIYINCRNTISDEQITTMDTRIASGVRRRGIKWAHLHPQEDLHTYAPHTSASTGSMIHTNAQLGIVSG